MISEKCSCGATFEVDFRYESNERGAVEDWRSNHQHKAWIEAPKEGFDWPPDESQTVARDVPKVQPRDWRSDPIQHGSITSDPSPYILRNYLGWVPGEDSWVWVGDGDQPTITPPWPPGSQATNSPAPW
jgi:hypothetical protein